MDELEALLAAAVQQKQTGPLATAPEPTTPMVDPQTQALLDQYVTALGGDLDRVPARAVDPSRVDWKQLDPRCGDLFGRVDGARSFRFLIAHSGLDQVNATYLYAVLVRSQLLR